MAKRIEYIPGQSLGDSGVIFIQEESPIISSKGRKTRRGLFQCPYCSNTFIASFTNVKRNHTKSCGCLQRQRTSEARTRDLTNQRFGRLVVLERTQKKSGSSVVWKCICDCGKEVEVSSNNLVSHATQSCGCLAREKHCLHILGQKFDRLTVIRKTEERKDGNIIWVCQCECGNIVKVAGHDLKRGHVRSCGCLKSKGESLIQKLLISLNIKFNREQVFKDCVNLTTLYPLRFDFYLPDYNICIEYDGEQHFKDGWESLEQTRSRDEIKNRYCRDNGIKLIRISYTDYDKINEKYLLERVKNDPL